MDCVFSTREQCSEDGRGRGFGTQCIRNPAYNPGLPAVVEKGSLVKKSSQRPRNSSDR
jgi:hypothetical protein